MAATSINIRVNIPRGKKINLDAIKHQVSLYAQFIINQMETHSQKNADDTLISMRGILKTDKTDKQLIDEYLSEKYKL